MMPTSSTSIQESPNLGFLAKEAGIAMTIRLVGVVLAYLVHVCFARWLGRSEYGIYQYVIAWSILVAIPVGLGFPRTVLRFVAEYQVKEEWGLLWGIIRSSWLITILTSLLLSLVIAGSISSWNYYYPFAYSIPLLIGIGLIPLQALINLQLETARTAKDVILAYTPSQIIWPILLIFGAFLFLETSHTLTSNSAIVIAEITLFVTVVFQLGLLKLKLQQEFVASEPVYAIRKWLGVALVVLLSHGSFIVLSNTDVIMVGSILGSNEAGTYAAAVNTAQWVSFVLGIINIVAAPSFAVLYAQGDNEGLQKVVSAVALWIFWPSVAIALLLTVFSQPILGLFGPGFMAASWQLKILVLGELVSALCGSVGYLMMMTGHQNKSVVVFVSAIGINIVLNGIAIPLVGAIGAAMATAFTTALWNIWLAILVVKYVGVNPLVFRGLLQWKSSHSRVET